jgi:rhodanese-related sulfurtransferase
MSYETIDPRTAHQRLAAEKDLVYLDVRSVQEFEQGHPEGAFNVPIAMLTEHGMEPNDEFLAVVERRFGKDQAMVVGCKMGGRSARACEVLAAAGFTRLANMDGGFSGRPGGGEAVSRGWSGCGLPVAATPRKGATWGELSSGA